MFSQELIGKNIMRLSTEERDRLFRVISDNADVFNKIMPGNQFLEFVATDKPAETDPVVAIFRDWKDNLE